MKLKYCTFCYMKLSSVEAKLKNFPVSYAYTGGSPVSSVVKPNLIALLVVEKMTQNQGGYNIQFCLICLYWIGVKIQHSHVLIHNVKYCAEHISKLYV